MDKILHQTYDEERALYNLKDHEVCECVFKGPLDGESVLKETRNCTVKKCTFSLRYPLWHAKNLKLSDSIFDEYSRAPLWYDENVLMENCNFSVVKCLRECSNVVVNNCNIDSREFAWKCDNITITNSKINSEYLLLDSNNVKIDHLTMSGKYTFQYMNNVEISNSYLDTKDAFWHSNNVTVRDSVVKGEYLGWFSNGLTLINCKIIGTQPLCYCKNLKLINCTMEQTDLAFEYSDVEADIKGEVLSIKNPKSGTIVCDGVSKIILEDQVMECHGKIEIRESR